MGRLGLKEFSRCPCFAFSLEKEPVEVAEPEEAVEEQEVRPQARNGQDLSLPVLKLCATAILSLRIHVGFFKSWFFL